MTLEKIACAALICLFLGIGSVAAVEMAALPAPELMTTATQSEPCCFTNPRFTGICQVTPGSDESCSSILGYLNNPNSVGRAYCGNTKVRGGWAQTDCEGSAQTATEYSCPVDPIQE